MNSTARLLYLPSRRHGGGSSSAAGHGDLALGLTGGARDEVNEVKVDQVLVPREKLLAISRLPTSGSKDCDCGMRHSELSGLQRDHIFTCSEYPSSL